MQPRCQQLTPSVAGSFPLKITISTGKIRAWSCASGTRSAAMLHATTSVTNEAVSSGAVR